MTIHNRDFSASHKSFAPLTNAEIAKVAPSVFAVAAHETRSSRYVYIPTSNILDGMRREGFVPVAAKQSRTRDASRKEFTKHLIRFRREGSETALTKVGDTFPEVVLVNSHDGTSSYQLMAGMFRLICLNGLIVGNGDLETVRIPHSGDILNRVIEGSYRVLEASTKALEVSDKWAGIHLNSTEQLAFAEAARVLRFADAEGNVTTPIEARQLLTTRRYDDRGDDLWRTFNTVQENVIRGGLTARTRPTPEQRRGRRVSTREVNGIDADVRLNKALWTLAEHMAKAKAA